MTATERQSRRDGGCLDREEAAGRVCLNYRTGIKRTACFERRVTITTESSINAYALCITLTNQTLYLILTLILTLLLNSTHVVSIQLNVVTCPTYAEKFIRDIVTAPFSLHALFSPTIWCKGWLRKRKQSCAFSRSQRNESKRDGRGANQPVAAPGRASSIVSFGVVFYSVGGRRDYGRTGGRRRARDLRRSVEHLPRGSTAVCIRDYFCRNTFHRWHICTLRWAT